MSDARVVGVLSVPEGLDLYTVGTCPANEGIQWILENLTVKADREYGIEAIEVQVLATEAGELVDVKLNEKSLGFFYVRRLVSALDGLKLPKLLVHGPEDEIDIKEWCDHEDYGVYVIPLFGELENAT